MRPRRRQHRLPKNYFWCVALSLSVAPLLGCGSSPLAGMRYAESTGVAGDNIQGTSLLASMFRDAGYRVTTARTLGRTVNRSNVVVWFPDRFRPPSQATCNFFEQWLSTAQGRTLLYVGRDYDADVAYWRRMEDEASAARDADASELYKVRRWRARARADLQYRLSKRSESDSCKWFQIDRNIAPRDAEEMTGPWSAFAAQAKYSPVVTTHLTPTAFQSENIRPLLKSGDELLVAAVSRPHWRKNKLILVANGSMFLNLPMVDAANRAVAQKLVAECGAPGRAVFLNSGAVDPAVAGAPQSHYLLRVFTTPPLRCILMHLSVLGMIYCFAVFPIFGRPRTLHEASRTDFGRHVMALGRLLARTGDTEYAYNTRREYLHKVQGAQIAELSPTAEAAGNPFRTDDESNEHETENV